ncbi:Undefined function [Listeria monocytogenes]|nr:Undefined function [Listeria monocytogenes]
MKSRFIVTKKLILSFQAAEDMDGEIAARPDTVLYDNELTIGENWSGRDRYVWLKTTITFPNTKRHALDWLL